MTNSLACMTCQIVRGALLLASLVESTTTAYGVGWGGARLGRLLLRIIWMAGSTVISARCRFAASWPWQVVTILSSVKSFSLTRSSNVSLSSRPSIIWSLMFFCVHWLLQMLLVLASSCTDTKKLSNVSPGCCVRRWKFLHSTDSLIWPSTYIWMAETTSLALPLCVSVNPRTSTIVTVSHKKTKYLFGLQLLVESWEGELCLPMWLPSFEVSSTVDLKIELW